MSNPRVLKAHRDALRAALPGAQALLAAGDVDGFIDTLATAVVTARDHETTLYCIGVRTPTGEPFLFGPYLGRASAVAAAEGGACSVHPAQRTGVFPLIPSPRGVKRSKTGPRPPRVAA